MLIRGDNNQMFRSKFKAAYFNHFMPTFTDLL